VAKVTLLVLLSVLLVPEPLSVALAAADPMQQMRCVFHD
jgi:hypothetical protein